MTNFLVCVTLLRKTFKYRLLGNKDTFNKADNWIGLCCRLYNVALEQRIMAWKMQRHYISLYDQTNEIPELRNYFSEYKAIDAQVLRSPLKRLDFAFKGFFSRLKRGEKVGFPRFKGRDRYHSFTLEHNGWKLNNKYLSIRNIGRLKLRLSRPIEGDIKTITIRRETTGKWYVFFSCNNVPEKKIPKSEKSVGVDVGIKSFLTDSDGNKIENPQYFRQAKAVLRRRQRTLHRRIKGSSGRKQARVLVAKAHEKIKNQRNDFLHKVANQYIANNDIICIEDLNVAGMVRNHNLAQSISDASWGKFFELLFYKAEEAGRTVIKVPRFEPTSKRCSSCGAINQELKLSDREWVCKSCGTLHDRDYNAAKNIRRVGQTLQELTYENAQCVS